MTPNISTALRYSFEDSDSAAQAREQLVHAGVAPERLSIHVLSDEAGPVAGNFALDSKDANRDDDDSVLDTLFARDDPNEGVAQQPVRWHSATLLLVEPEDDEERDRIAALLGVPGDSI